MAGSDSPRVVWFAAWPVTAVFVLSNTATPLYVLWQERIGFSSGTLTVIFACYIVGLLGALPVAGVTSDRIGRRPVLLPALALGVVASVIFATATSVAALAVARLLTGVAVGVVVSAGMAAVTDVAGQERRRLGALLASTAMVLGAGLGPMLAGVLSQTLPAPTVTVFLLEIALLALAVLVVLRMPLRRPARPAPTGPWIRLPSVPRANRRELLLGVAVFAPGITATSYVLSLGPSLLSRLLDTDNRIVAGLMAFVMFGAATGVQFAVRRVGVRGVLLAGAMAGMAAMAGLVIAVHQASVPLLLVTAALAGTAQGLGQLGGLTLLGETVPAARRAEANAALNTGGYVPAGLLPVLAGYLADAVGLTAATTVFATVVLAASATGAVLVARTAPQGRRDAVPTAGALPRRLGLSRRQ
ncbi:MFS transporter [Streptomyces sp. 8K308]|uniref:MFS transporter n=1 Tax=Streptomyces sp. 8K308 TaxID=2530388 RepID=UPI001048B83C|nr:MFS transporter [Streptomyces sp. 8K308]TDC22830.1 MFS transporter [Streptomyces sp. 8K308]